VAYETSRSGHPQQLELLWVTEVGWKLVTRHSYLFLAQSEDFRN